MDKTNDSAVLSLRLQGAALAELTERAQYVGKTRSRFARELIMKALAVPAPARTIFRTVDAEELTKPYALKLLLKESENAALTRISTAQGMSRQQLVIGLIRCVGSTVHQRRNADALCGDLGAAQDRREHQSDCPTLERGSQGRPTAWNGSSAVSQAFNGTDEPHGACCR